MIEPDPDRESEADAEYFDEPEPVVFTVDASAFQPRRHETPEEILRWMKARQKFVGSPLPEGYVPPPGIDIDALLRQLPQPRTRT